MSLFDPPITCVFTDDELAIITLPVVGGGGHQRLQREIIGKLDGNTAVLEDSMLQKCARYAFDYGAGGYQGRFKVVIATARRAGWSRP